MDGENSNRYDRVSYLELIPQNILDGIYNSHVLDVELQANGLKHLLLEHVLVLAQPSDSLVHITIRSPQLIQSPVSYIVQRIHPVCDDKQFSMEGIRGVSQEETRL